MISRSEPWSTSTKSLAVEKLENVEKIEKVEKETEIRAPEVNYARLDALSRYCAICFGVVFA